MLSPNKFFLFGRNINLTNIISIIIDIIIMLMPTIGYFDTLRIMIKNKSPDAYPEQIVIILLLAHSMKILYFIHHHYAIRIFGQSISQVIVALLLTYTKFYYSIEITKSKRRRSSAHDDIEKPNHKFCRFRIPRNFFEFLLYTISPLCGIFVVFYICYHNFNHRLVVDLLSYLANLIESTISVPLFVKIVIHKDLNNVSTLLIVQYIVGDIMKLVLFILDHTPISFIAGSIMQLTLDFTVCAFFIHLRIKNQNKSDGVMLIQKRPNYEYSESLTSETEDEKPILTTEKFEV